MPLKAAQEVDLGRWTVTPEFVNDYLAAVEDGGGLYREKGLAPPMALAARTLGLLIEKLELPPGTVHTSQETRSQKAVALGQEVSGWAKTSRPFTKGQWQFLSVSFALRCDGEEALTGKTTVMSPVEG